MKFNHKTMLNRNQLIERIRKLCEEKGYPMPNELERTFLFADEFVYFLKKKAKK